MYIVLLYNTVALSESNTRAPHSNRFPWLRCSFISAWRHSPVKTRGISMSCSDISGTGIHRHDSLVYIWHWYMFTVKLMNASHFECFWNILTQSFDLLRCNEESSRDENKLGAFDWFSCLCFFEYINFSGMLNGDDSLQCQVEVLFPTDKHVHFIYLFICVYLCVCCFLCSTVSTSLRPQVALNYCYQFSSPHIFSLHRRILLDFPHCNRSQYRV